jgi:hypothetical protein
MAIAFLLLGLLVQATGLAMARHRASAVATSAAIDASRPGSHPSAVSRAAVDSIERMLPGADRVTAAVSLSRTQVSVRVRFRWLPPGPAWVPVWMSTSATAARVVPP